MTTGALQGTTIGSYVVRHEIGNGGMGAVYLVEHTMLGRKAALKVLHPEMSANQEMVQRFFNEARAASAIKSPGIVEIYDFGYHTNGSAYIVMELLEGESLSMRLNRYRSQRVPQALPSTQALIIARQIASALAPAHRAGIVHRDLKPDNIYLVPDTEAASGERAKILDFGIAKLSSDGLGSGMNMTSTKMVMGSPHYMSPEQCRGAGVVDARSDLYALGCILYECLSGQPPFVGEGFGELMGAHLHVAPQPLRNFAPALPLEVDALVQRLLAKNPAQRYQSAEETAGALNELMAQLRSGSVVAQLQPSAATMHMSPGSRPMMPAMPTPGPMQGAMHGGMHGMTPMPGHLQRMPTPGPMQVPQHLAQSGAYVMPGSQPGMPAPGSPTTMRHSSGSSTMPPERSSGGRSMVLIAATAGLLSAAVVAVVMLRGGDKPADAPVAVASPPSTEAASPTTTTTITAPAAPPSTDVPLATDVPAATDVPPTAADPAPSAATIEVKPEPTAPVGDGAAGSGAAGSGSAQASGEGSGSGSATILRPRRKKVEPIVAPVIAPPPLPETLSSSAQAAGYDSVKGKIKACAEAKGVKGPLSVYVSIEVMPSGKVRQARVTSGNNPNLSACVSSILINAVFQPTQQGGTFRKIYVQE
jgi:serine/threonine protein kinase